MSLAPPGLAGAFCAWSVRALSCIRLTNWLSQRSFRKARAAVTKSGVNRHPAKSTLLRLGDHVLDSSPLTSASDAAPPLGGIAPMPFMTEAVKAAAPLLIRVAHTALSPAFGAIAERQPAQVLSYTALPHCGSISFALE